MTRFSSEINAFYGGYSQDTLTQKHSMPATKLSHTRLRRSQNLHSNIEEAEVTAYTGRKLIDNIMSYRYKVHPQRRKRGELYKQDLSSLVQEDDVYEVEIINIKVKSTGRCCVGLQVTQAARQIAPTRITG